MNPTTYSFIDSVIVVSHPSLNSPIIIVGEGAGSVTVAMAETRTVHDAAADGSIMVSKVAGNHGTVNIDVQQTSKVHKKLLNLFNSLVVGTTDKWAQATISVRNITDKTGHVCTGVSPQKVPDKAYAKNGAHITWVFMAADIENTTVN